jgi:hypothetical protein
VARAKKNAVPLAGAAGVIAAAGAAVVGLTPTLAASPQLLANVEYVRGTNIGDNPSDAAFKSFADSMILGTAGGTVTGPCCVDYPGGFWPVSNGGLSDPTYDASVDEGLAALNSEAQTGDVIFGFSQGAVVASEYKGTHTGNTYVLVENPNRPNGGILERFNGLHIPILDVSFNGATPDNGDLTYDISRQYDGWSDFPTDPLNLLATANAVAGIYYLHGKTQDLTSADLPDASDGSMYYQQHGDTTYYLIPTDELPILMPFNGIVPDPVLKALDPPLRVLVELGYNRSDYSTPTPAGIAPIVNPITVAENLAKATVEGVQAGLADSGVSAAVTPSITEKAVAAPTPSSKLPDLTKGALTPGVLTLPKPRNFPKPPNITVNPLSSLFPSTTGPTKAAEIVKSNGRGSLGGPAKAVQSALKALSPKHFAPKKADKTTDHDAAE